MRVGLVLIVSTLAACGESTPESRAVVQADSMAVDRARCVLPVGTAIADSLAVRCAELFAIRNGYTDLPPVPDSTRWTYEFMDLGIEGRRGMLERRAHALCGDIQADSAVLVVFRYRPGREAPPAVNEKGEVVERPPTGRAVSVRSDFSAMRFVHQDLVLPTLDGEREGGCRILNLNRNGASAVPPAQPANAGDDPAL